MSDNSQIARFENTLLSRITLITNLGDFISIFAIFKITHEITDSALIAGYSVAIQALATALAGLLLPTAVCRFSTRSLILWTQWLSFAVMAALWALYETELLKSVEVLFAVVALITLLNEVFKASRETHSRGFTGSADEHRSLQAQLLGSFYGAQFLGPLLAFALLWLLPTGVALAIDAASFALAAILSLSLRRGPLLETSLSIRAPLRYVFRRPMLLKLFLMRSVFFWVPIGIFNLMLFPLISDRLALPVEYTAWVYSLVGLGATLAAMLLRSPQSSARNWIARKDDRGVTATGLFALAAVVAAIAFSSDRVTAIGVTFFFGVAMSFNAIGSQSMRRRLCSKDEFPEVVGLELIVGRLMEWVAASVVVALLKDAEMGLATPFLVSAGALVLLGFYSLQFREEILKEGN